MFRTCLYVSDADTDELIISQEFISQAPMRAFLSNGSLRFGDGSLQALKIPLRVGQNYQVSITTQEMKEDVEYGR